MAYKAKQTVKVAVLRQLKTAIKNRQIELGRPVEDGEALDIVAKQAKQRKESLDQFRAAGRDDLADNEAAELVELEAYLPSQLGPEELERAIDAAIAEVGAAGMQDMGRVMQALLDANKGRVDGKAASALVRSRLA